MPKKSPVDATYNPELAERLKNPPKQLCPIGQIIAEHPNGQDVKEAIENLRWSATALAPVLSKAIQPMSRETITRHRNGTCVCENP